MMSEIIHKELSFQIIRCVFDVHNAVGPGVREECYQKAVEQRLYEGGIPFIAKQATRREMVYRDVVVDVFEPDLVVADCAIQNQASSGRFRARERFASVELSEVLERRFGFAGEFRIGQSGLPSHSASTRSPLSMKTTSSSQIGFGPNTSRHCAKPHFAFRR